MDNRPQQLPVESLFTRQLELWPEAKANYKTLNRCRRVSVDVDGTTVTVMYNPARIRSSAADISSRAIATRPCFLCSANRPKQQLTLQWEDYDILVNPYPIFTPHFTIAARIHTPQSIAGHMAQMIELARRLEGLTVFYNGPRSGASAPDHLHFQAVPSAALPMWQTIDAGKRWPVAPIWIADTQPDRLAARVEGELWNMGQGHEPDVNIYARTLSDGEVQVVIIPRKAHRPSIYGSGEGQVLVSPASAEMAGVIVAPRPEDMELCTNPDIIKLIFSDCTPDDIPTAGGERTLDVGIVRAVTLDVRLNGDYTLNGKPCTESTLHLRASGNGMVECGGASAPSFHLIPADSHCSFTLGNVTIGIGFHWQRHEEQAFHGQLEVWAYPDGTVQAVNRVGMETYLRSVVSSEMNANAPEEFLKAHAVISRSWVLAQLVPPAHLADHAMTDTEGELIRWYDRDAHDRFDICADDHCQRYQGCTKASTPQVEAALRSTRGEVLAYGTDLCDARFSKCCGGVTELFSTCWQPTGLPYLTAIDDPFCGRATAPLLHRVLNNYDRSTSGYYRWEVTYTADELSDIIRRRSGTDYGLILALTPLHRGPSGRIDRLEIKGTKCTRIIGKELEIRRTLSESHLYSSAFIVEPSGSRPDGVPAAWTLRGLGWGHGVGLCQIGAAEMAHEGYDYRSILSFYFPGSRLITLYDDER